MNENKCHMLLEQCSGVWSPRNTRMSPTPSKKKLYIHTNMEKNMKKFQIYSYHKERQLTKRKLVYFKHTASFGVKTTIQLKKGGLHDMFKQLEAHELTVPLYHYSKGPI